MMSSAGAHSAAGRDKKMWPFGTWSFGAKPSSSPSKPAPEVPHAEAKVAPAAEAEKRASIEDIKDQVMLTQAFGQKTQALCVDAQPQDRTNCRRLAGERLFCALLRRHAHTYASLVGAAAEKEKCSRIDIMENAVEAAKDQRDQEEANKA